MTVGGPRVWLTTFECEVVAAERLAGFELVPGDGRVYGVPLSFDTTTVLEATLWARIDAGSSYDRIIIDIVDRLKATARLEQLLEVLAAARDMAGPVVHVWSGNDGRWQAQPSAPREHWEATMFGYQLDEAHAVVHGHDHGDQDDDQDAPHAT